HRRRLSHEHRRLSSPTAEQSQSHASRRDSRKNISSLLQLPSPRETMSQPVSEDVSQITSEITSTRSGPRPDRKATWMLILITSMWGFSFTLMKNWQDAAKGCPGGEIVAGLTMVALRMFLALVVLGVFLPRLFRDPTRREFMTGLLLGGINSLGFVFQV